MPVVETRSVFSGIPVSEAMRRQVITLPCLADIGQGIRFMIRYKANAVLLTDDGVRNVLPSTFSDLLCALAEKGP